MHGTSISMNKNLPHIDFLACLNSLNSIRLKPRAPVNILHDKEYNVPILVIISKYLTFISLAWCA